MTYMAIADKPCGCGGEVGYYQTGYQPGGGFQIGLPGFGGGFNLPYSPANGYAGAGIPLPSNYALERRWYDPIIEIAGAIGKDLLVEVGDWLKERIGQEAWDRAPAQTKQAMVDQALRSYGINVPSSIPWTPILLGGLAVFALMQIVPRR